MGRLGETGEDTDKRNRLLGVVTRLEEEMPLRKGGDVGKAVWASGGELLAPHIDVERVKNYFGEQHKVDQFAQLEQIARVGVPVDVGPGGNFDRKVTYGNHSSARKHVTDVWENAVGGVKKGRAIVMPLRVAQVAHVEGGGNLRQRD